jgi:hypothetical protein
VPIGYRSRLGFLPDIRKHYSQDTAVETSVRSAKRIKKPAVGRDHRAVVVAASLRPLRWYLARRRSAVATTRRTLFTHCIYRDFVLSSEN